MLTDMPDEDNKALTKRQMIQQIMEDKSLSTGERNKKIQDVMAGRVELPKLEPKQAPSETSTSSSPENTSDAPLTGGEAMLQDMPDEDNKALYSWTDFSTFSFGLFLISFAVRPKRSVDKVSSRLY